ncbi:MAG: YggW family oxidoreductase [gamma proteobacterium symbiont of Ctena orbiculata]|nr:MAG: YggW family oxidoreductase [gamma proteobacterium symbiont of Ctena orbiculata]
MLKPPPLSLYIHIPWCARKCPYCDFNSHTQHGPIQEMVYVEALLQDLGTEQKLVAGRPLQTIFIGGGTPSLFSAQAIERLLSGVAEVMALDGALEITLEANPGALESERLPGYREAGINRLSLGIQSLNPESLQALGRIHGPEEVLLAVERARQAGFERINLDLMFGLPAQTLEMAQGDLQAAIGLGPSHLSYYQLTLEPNTPFYQSPPDLPDEERLWQIQQQGHEMLLRAGFQQYEISAFSRPHEQCRHNLNYWRFGDYIGIGAGAHGKLSTQDGVIRRRWKRRHPNDYLAAAKGAVPFLQGERVLHAEDLVIEFMMNALRLSDGVEADLFSATTGLDLECMGEPLNGAIKKGLLYPVDGRLCPTPLGLRFLNDLIAIFEVNSAT